MKALGLIYLLLSLLHFGELVLIDPKTFCKNESIGFFHCNGCVCEGSTWNCGTEECVGM